MKKVEIDVSKYVSIIPQRRADEIFKYSTTKPNNLFSVIANEIMIDENITVDEMRDIFHEITETIDVENVEYIQIRNYEFSLQIELLQPFTKLKGLELSCRTSIQELSKLKLDTLVYLYMAISTEVIEHALPTMPSLMYLVLSTPVGKTSVSNLSHGQVLAGKKFKFNSIPCDFLHKNPQLSQIRLSAHIREFPHTFFHKSTSLTELSIEGDFDGFPQFLLRPLNDLLYLNIQLDGKEAIPYIFKSLSKLEFLQVHLRDIKSVPDGFFDGMDNLQTLKVHLNESCTDINMDDVLLEVSENLFMDLTNLRVLEWEGIIQKIPAKLFHNQYKLTRLYLKSAYTRHIDSDAFTHLTALSELVFFVQVSKFKNETFSGLHSLKRLLILSTTLEEVKSPLFNDLPNLESLIIVNRGVRPFKVDTDIVADCSKLVNLELQYIEPVGLLFKLFNDFQTLHTVELVIPPEYEDKLQAYLRISAIEVPYQIFVDPAIERLENGGIRQIERLKIKFNKVG